MDTKTCQWCGQEQPVDQYRKYYNREGQYSFCKTCEQIEARRKYLVRTGQNPDELKQILELYERRRAAGLMQHRKTTVSVLTIVEQELKKRTG